MSIQSEIDRIENNIAATYSELEEQGATMPSARNSANLAAAAATTKTVKYIAQTLTAAEKEQARENIGVYSVSVKDYGAKGNGSTDDTAAFQNALANERVVTVPAGKYKLSSELVLGQNCKLELEQDATLYFTQTTGNCISMKASSNIEGNHAAIIVPYAFSGRVINIYAGLDASIMAIPPYTAWGPMWNAARYITDLHIAKLDSSGVAQSTDGTCSGTAIYLGASYQDAMNFLWAVDITRIRIAGAFSYGVYLDTVMNPSDNLDGWIHQTRISGFVENAEVGVYVKNSTLTYLSVMVLPKWAANNTKYAKHGIVLENSTNVDLSGSRVMDWDANHSLWVEGSMYQHLALIGDCSGAILNEHYYYDTSNYDIRSLIYTDTPSNLERLVILQEPFTRWFKPREGVPYFSDGKSEKQLCLMENLKEIADTERVADFTDVLPTAQNTDGSIFNGKGYAEHHARLLATGAVDTTSSDVQYYGCTGFIAIKPNDVIYCKNITLTDDGYTAVVVSNSSFTTLKSATGKVLPSMTYYYTYEPSEDGFKLTVKGIDEQVNAAYIRFGFKRTGVGVNPAISINKPIVYAQAGYLQDGIKVKSENVEGLSEILGSYITDIDTLVGGGF